MAHFVELGAGDTVMRLHIVPDELMLDEHGVPQESIGSQICNARTGGKWIQTFPDGSRRKNYAEVVYGTYDRQRDAFIPRKPFPSWALNEETFRWGAPVPYPVDGNSYTWDEPTLSWVQIAQPE